LAPGSAKDSGATWRTLGMVILCGLAIAFLVVRIGFSSARLGFVASLLHQGAGAPRYQDLDRGCPVEAGRFLCLGAARYDLQGRLVAHGDWGVVRDGKSATIEAQSYPSELRVEAKTAAGLLWTVEIAAPYQRPLRDGLYTGADTTSVYRPHLRLSLNGPFVGEPRQVETIPKLPLRHPQWCEGQVARFQVSHLRPKLREGQVDFERSCKDDEGYWVLVGRIVVGEPRRWALPQIGTSTGSPDTLGNLRLDTVVAKRTPDWVQPPTRVTVPGKILGWADLPTACAIDAPEFVCLLNHAGEDLPGGASRQVLRSVSMEVQEAQGPESRTSVSVSAGTFHLLLAPPQGSGYLPALYVGAGQNPRDLGHPLLAGQEAINAGFRILEAETSPNGMPSRLVVDFEWIGTEGWIAAGRFAAGLSSSAP
jgi:hypothetical protein